tara:strand:+ start:590 stop:2272 length:1683 start_codon:yes stop_codon:yes gene_type:complete
MALNPFFLQGSQSEQRLVQSLIDEQLKIYGVEVTYIPRKYVRKQTVLKEVQSSVFDDNFLLEAYVDTYEGYGGQGDIMTKFGVSLKDELTVTISKERFEDFISPFLDAMPDDEIELATRPREGDLVYFPLGQRLFEVKFVEHENPFYQLGKNYVYQLKCELFEYEDEVLDTDIEAIDTQLEDLGFITTLNLIGTGATATANAVLTPANKGYVRQIFLNNDGSGYSTPPTVAISTAPSGTGNANATAVAITTHRAGIYSIDHITLVSPGAGYTETPTVTITGGGGIGAAATAYLESAERGILSFTMTNNGVGYAKTPTVTVTGIGSDAYIGVSSIAVVEPVMSVNNTINSLRLRNAGVGYTQTPTVTISNPAIYTGVGNFEFNEIVVGKTSKAQGRVKEWDKDTNIIKISNVGIGSTVPSGFLTGEIIQATESTVFNTVVSTAGTIGITTTIITGITTSNIVVGQLLKPTYIGVGNSIPVIGAASTVTSVGVGTVYINPPSVNTIVATGVTVSFGTTEFSNYSVKSYVHKDTYSEYDSNDEIEDLADSFLDFTQSNPFGQV